MDLNKPYKKILGDKLSPEYLRSGEMLKNKFPFVIGHFSLDDVKKHSIKNLCIKRRHLPFMIPRELKSYVPFVYQCSLFERITNPDFEYKVCYLTLQRNTDWTAEIFEQGIREDFNLYICTDGKIETCPEFKITPSHNARLTRMSINSNIDHNPKPNIPIYTFHPNSIIRMNSYTPYRLLTDGLKLYFVYEYIH